MKTLIKKIGNLYIRLWCRREFRSQKYVAFNERPVEYRFLFEQLIRYCPRRILDVGTGSTALPHIMKTCGFVVTAIDNIRDFWPKGFTNRHFYVIDDDIRSPSLRGSYDMITCISVLEHIMDHHRAVRSMFKLLKDDGHLILTFPYNEKRYCRNVYESEGSGAPKNLPYVTQAFSRDEVEEWIHENGASIVAQEYWRFFTGDLWTVGERLPFPERVDRSEPHQITCILLEKNAGHGGAGPG